jgi:hypothetical protein
MRSFWRDDVVPTWQMADIRQRIRKLISEHLGVEIENRESRVTEYCPAEILHRLRVRPTMQN